MSARRRAVPRRAPTQDRSRKRVARILRATSSLLDRHGLAAVTTNAIARRARIPVGTIYQFFPNRDAILRSLAQSCLDELESRLARELSAAAGPREPRVLVNRVLSALREAYVSIPGLATLVGTTQGHPELEAIYGMNNRRIVEGVAAVLATRFTGLPAPVAVATAIVEASDGVLRHWLRTRARGEPDQPAVLAALESMLAAYLESLERDTPATTSRGRRKT